MNDQPSEEEIQVYLEGYNRLARSWVRNAESGNAKAKGISNYEQWFKSHGIEICQDLKTHEWKRRPPRDLQSIE